MGKVVLVGAGPGDAGLITVLGEKYIRKADCIIYDRLISRDLLAKARPDCELIYAGKENHRHIMEQEKINALLAAKAGECSLVVRLKGGDPYVFGRGSEEALFLTEKGIEVEVVPGVSSCISVLSAAGIPATHRGAAKGFKVLTAQKRKGEAVRFDPDQLADKEETLIFLMGMSSLSGIVQSLRDAGREDSTPMAVIMNGTRSSQKKAVGRLCDIERKVKEAGIGSPAVIVAGDVVSFSDKLAFSEKRPLFGKTFFVPYIRSARFDFNTGWMVSDENGLADQIKRLGGKAVTYVTGEILPVRCDLSMLSELTDDDYIVFTSRNGVYAFMWNLKEQGLDVRSLGRTGLAAVGKKTADSLREFGLQADVVSPRSDSGDLGKVLRERTAENTRVYWYSAKETTESFADILRDCCQFRKFAVYENAPVSGQNKEQIREKIRDCEGVIFTSGSNAERTREAFDLLPDRVYSIGKSCSRSVRKTGLNVYAEAQSPSYEELIRLLWTKD